MLRHAGNAVTLLRLVLTPVFLWLVVRAAGGRSGWPAAGLFAVIAASDFVDGRLARRFGAASDGGRLFDHGSDILFVLSSLSLYAGLGLASWWVPAAVAASFAVYVADSAWRPGHSGWPNLVGSRVGHAAGVFNYAVIGVLVGNETVGLRLLGPAAVAALLWLVPVYSAAAIATRLLAYRNRAGAYRVKREA